MGMLYKMVEDILKLLYPGSMSCLFCNAHMDNANSTGLCSKCLSNMEFVSDNVCTICGRPIYSAHAISLCSECSGRNTYFDGGCTVFEFTGAVQHMIHMLKYDGETGLASLFGIMMAAKLKKSGWDVDVIIPVPLHEDRLRERGFNQSYLLAREIGRECSINVEDRVLFRDRYTKSQVELTGLERAHNVSGVFKAASSRKIYGKNVLIVDDIMTTGSTLNECSKVLKEQGASKVYCITAACPVYF